MFFCVRIFKSFYCIVIDTTSISKSSVIPITRNGFECRNVVLVVNIKLDKRKIVLDEPIKAVGVYTVKCKLGYEINADLKVEVKEG